MPTIANYRGIIPAISTPFKDDNRIDEAALRKLASWLATHEAVVAVMTNGHTGEVFALDPNERAEVTRIVADELKGKLPVISSVATLASAQSYPNKQVRVIIPFPPGGTLDTVGRLLAQKLGEQTGQVFVIENRLGGNGTIGADAVAKATADGYTLLFNASTFVTSTIALKTPPYDTVKDFAPIALVAKAPLAVAIDKALPVTDMKSFIAYAQANPGKLSFAIGSSASAGHLATEQLRRAVGVEFTIVPYKGSTPAYQDLLGSRITGFIDPILGSAGYAKAGQLRVIAVTSAKRVPSMPDVAAVGETVPGYEAFSWYGLWAPAKTSAEIVTKLNAMTNKALAGDMNDRLLSNGLIIEAGTPEDFAKFQREDTVRSMKTISDSGIKFE